MEYYKTSLHNVKLKTSLLSTFEMTADLDVTFWQNNEEHLYIEGSWNNAEKAITDNLEVEVLQHGGPS
jgi:hypothetical protein